MDTELQACGKTFKVKVFSKESFFWPSPPLYSKGSGWTITACLPQSWGRDGKKISVKTLVFMVTGPNIFLIIVKRHKAVTLPDNRCAFETSFRFSFSPQISGFLHCHSSYTEGQTTGFVRSGLTSAPLTSNLNWEHDLWPARHAVKINTRGSRGMALCLTTSPHSVIFTVLGPTPHTIVRYYSWFSFSWPWSVSVLLFFI